MKFRKIAALFSAAAVALSMSTVAYAETVAFTQEDYDNAEEAGEDDLAALTTLEAPVTVTVTPADVVANVSVDITRDSLELTFTVTNPGTWDPTTGTYSDVEGYWGDVDPNGEGVTDDDLVNPKITFASKSNVPVNIAAVFANPSEPEDWDSDSDGEWEPEFDFSNATVTLSAEGVDLVALDAYDQESADPLEGEEEAPEVPTAQIEVEFGGYLQNDAEIAGLTLGTITFTVSVTA